MTRDDLEHAAHCSLRIERMTATFNRRLDNGAMFVQIVLGLAVFAEVSAIKTVGAAVAIISIWMFVYRPAPKALLAAQQQRKYEDLCATLAGLSDADLSAEFTKIGKSDSEEMEFICHAAENALHINAQSEPPHKLGSLQKVLLWIAGS